MKWTYQGSEAEFSGEGEGEFPRVNLSPSHPAAAAAAATRVPFAETSLSPDSPELISCGTLPAFFPRETEIDYRNWDRSGTCERLERPYGTGTGTGTGRPAANFQGHRELPALPGRLHWPLYQSVQRAALQSPSPPPPPYCQVYVNPLSYMGYPHQEQTREQGLPAIDRNLNLNLPVRIPVSGLLRPTAADRSGQFEGYGTAAASERSAVRVNRVAPAARRETDPQNGQQLWSARDRERQQQRQREHLSPDDGLWEYSSDEQDEQDWL